MNWPIDLSGAPAGAEITDVDVEYWINHTWVGDLNVWLTTERGGSWYDKQLWNREGGDSDDIHEKETGLDQWDGLDPDGRWYLMAADYAAGDTGEIDAWKIWVHWSTPEVTSLSWRSGSSSGSSVVSSREAGQTVYLRADAIGMMGQTITVDIYEDDGLLPDDYIESKQITIGSSGFGTTSWTTYWVDDQSGGPEYVIKYPGLESGLLDVTDTTPPSAFDLSSPANGALFTASSLTFSWQTSDDAWYGCGFDDYTLQVDDDSNFGSPLINRTGLTSTSRTEIISDNGTYYWRVIAYDNNDNPRYSSSTRNFERQTPRVTGLSWRSGSSSGSSVVSSREAGQTVYLRADAIGMMDQTITDDIYEDDGLLPDDYIESKQITIGSSGFGTTSWTTYWVDDQSGGPEYVIKYPGLESGLLDVTDTTPPSAFDLSSPANGALFTASSLTFSWQTSDDAWYGCGFDDYTLQVDDDSNFGSPLINRTGLTSTSRTEIISDNGTYYWRVIAYDNNDNPRYSSSTRSFEREQFRVDASRWVDAAGTPVFVANDGDVVYMEVTTSGGDGTVDLEIKEADHLDPFGDDSIQPLSVDIVDGYGLAAWTAQYQGDDGWSPVNHFYVHDQETGIESCRLQVFDLSQYTNVGTTDIHELVFDYAPILRLDESDYFSPKEVDIFTWNTTLRDGSGAAMAWNGTVEGLGDYTGDNYYLDLPASTHSGAVSNVAAISSNFGDAIYATVVEDVSLDRLAVEYWFPYYMSGWGNQGGYNTHEGDWEGIVVTFSDAGPEKAAYSQHKTAVVDLSKYRDWANVEKTANHPMVYVGLGGHASYFTDSDYVGPESILAPDLNYYDEHHDGNGIVLSPASGLEINVVPNGTAGSLSSMEWLKFGGHWGQEEWEDPDRLFGGDGPIGPSHSTYWADPFSWVDGLPEEPGPFPTRFRDDFFEAMTVTAGTPILLEGKLEEDTFGNPDIANEDIYFQMDLGSGWDTISEDGISFSHLTTDANGIGSVYYLVPEGLTPGDYEYRAVYEGVGDYAGTVSLPQTLNVTGSATLYPETPVVEHTIGSGVPLILIHGNGNEGQEEAAWGTFLDYVNTHSADYAPFDIYNWAHDTHLAVGFNGVTGNAAELERFVDDYVLPSYSPGTKPVFLAHSRGGLVARSFMNYAGQGDDVLGLVTLGTPHHGSPFAVPDWDAVSWALRVDTTPFAEDVFDTLVSPDGKDWPIVGVKGPMFDTDRMGSLNLAWDNMDSAITGTISVSDFNVIIANNGSLQLTPQDMNNTSAQSDPTIWFSDLYKSTCGTLATLNQSEQYYDKIVAFAAYDNVLGDNPEMSNALNIIQSIAGSLSSDHQALSVITDLLAEMHLGVVGNNVNYVANDGMVPLQSALLLDTSGGIPFASIDSSEDVTLDWTNINSRKQVKAQHVWTGTSADHLWLLDATEQGYWDQVTDEIVGFLDFVPPTANLAGPLDGTSIERATLNARGYIDVMFADTGGSGPNAATITDAGQEFTLTGAGVGTASVSGVPSHMGGTTYRYTFGGEFESGPVNVNFLAGGWGDHAGNLNLAETEGFTVAEELQSPTAVIVSVAPSPADPQTDTVVFSEASYDNDEGGASIVSWEWRSDAGDWQGNSILSTQREPSISANDFRVDNPTTTSHTITLTVTDDEGETDTATATLLVWNATPIIDSLDVSPATAVPGEPITLTATAHDRDEHQQAITGWRIDVTGSGFSDTFVVGGGNLNYQIATAGLAEGTYIVSVQANDDEDTWSNVATDTFDVPDTAPPEVVGWEVGCGTATIQRSAIRAVRIEFSEDVSASPATDRLVLENLTTGETIAPADMARSYSPGTDTAEWTFPGLSGGRLPDGNYAATLLAAGVTDGAGNELQEDYEFEFFSFFGDADGDRDVDSADLFEFRKTYQKDSTDPAFDPIFDVDADGDVDFADLFKFRKNYQKTLEVPFELVVSGAELTVPEGSTAEFTVELLAQPRGTITVTTARTDGDEDLNVDSGTTLTFDNTNWNIPQPVTLAAAEDADTINGTAEFTVSANGATNQPVVTVTEDDDDSTSGMSITLDFVIPTNGPVEGVGLSPNGSRLYAAFWEDNPTSRVQEYGLPEGQLLQTIEYGSYHTHGDVVVSADGNRIFTTNYYSSDVSQIELDNGNARTDLSTQDSWPGNIDITPDRTKALASVGMDGGSYDMNNDSIAIYDVAGGNFALLASVKLDDEPRGRKIAFSPDSQFAYVVTHVRKSDHAKLYEISLSGAYEVSRSMEFAGVETLWSVAVANGKVYVGGPDDPKLWVVDTATWSVVSEIDLTDAPGTSLVYPGGEYLFVLLPDAQAITVLDIGSERIVTKYDGLDVYPTDIEFNSDASRMYVSHGTGNGNVWVFDVDVVLSNMGATLDPLSLLLESPGQGLAGEEVAAAMGPAAAGPLLFGMPPGALWAPLWPAASRTGPTSLRTGGTSASGAPSSLVPLGPQLFRPDARRRLRRPLRPARLDAVFAQMDASPAQARRKRLAVAHFAANIPGTPLSDDLIGDASIAAPAARWPTAVDRTLGAASDWL